MQKNIERVYNIFSWWFILWYFLYIHKIVSANPFIAAAITIVWDLYATYFITNAKTNTTQPTMATQMVSYFRIMAIIAAHWIPLITLPRYIDFESIVTFISLGIFYLVFLYIQGLTPYEVYGKELNSKDRIHTIWDLFTLRYGSIPMGILGFGFLFYTTFLLLQHPAKGSLLYKINNI
tara:strand:- start:61 stop:594 length:534 start_codon:yes stop_codon:yes gene_type:complete